MANSRGVDNFIATAKADLKEVVDRLQNSNLNADQLLDVFHSAGLPLYMPFVTQLIMRRAANDGSGLTAVAEKDNLQPPPPPPTLEDRVAALERGPRW